MFRRKIQTETIKSCLSMEAKQPRRTENSEMFCVQTDKVMMTEILKKNKNWNLNFFDYLFDYLSNLESTCATLSRGGTDTSRKIPRTYRYFITYLKLISICLISALYKLCLQFILESPQIFTICLLVTAESLMVSSLHQE